MQLWDVCKRLTKNDSTKVTEETSIGQWIMTPEYSVNNVDVKTFSNWEIGGMFMLCWNMEKESKLYATIKPSQSPFSYSKEFVSGEKTQIHTHDYIELGYVVEGEFKQKILGKDISFKKGELFLIDKNCLHQDYLYDDGSLVIFIGLANEIFDEVMVGKINEEKMLDFLRNALMKQKDIQQYLHFKPKNLDNGKLEKLLMQLWSELESPDDASKYICKGLIIRILHMLSTEYNFYLSNEHRKKMNWIVFEEITKYINEHYIDITIKDLVDKFHFNEDYYNRILKEKTGMTYSEYVQNIRLGNAEKLLRTTKNTVDEVAHRVGYHNRGYFYKIFIEKYEMTPAKYRKSKNKSV